MAKVIRIRRELTRALDRHIAELHRARDLVLTCDSVVCRAAVSAFGDYYEAALWLADGNPALGGHSPLSAAQGTTGRRSVLRILAQIENGVFA